MKNIQERISQKQQKIQLLVGEVKALQGALMKGSEREKTEQFLQKNLTKIFIADNDENGSNEMILIWAFGTSVGDILYLNTYEILISNLNTVPAVRNGIRTREELESFEEANKSLTLKAQLIFSNLRAVQKEIRKD